MDRLDAIKATVERKGSQTALTFVVVGKRYWCFFSGLDHCFHSFNLQSSFCILPSSWVSYISSFLSIIVKMLDSEGDRKGNCRSGSVIDSQVTNATRNDFYLQSHTAIQGSKTNN